MLIAAFLVSGAATATAASSTLIITEIDYDQPGTDPAEFVEIFNAARTPATLDGIALVFFNAATTPAEEYLRITLPGAVPGRRGYRVQPDASDADPGALSTSVPGSTEPDPERAGGAALVRLSTGSAIDAVAYEAPISSAQITGGPVVDLGRASGPTTAAWPTGRCSGRPMDLRHGHGRRLARCGLDTRRRELHLFGTTGNDSLTDHTPVANVICGGPGNDALIGLDGGDVLVGGAGHRHMLGGRGDDVLDGRSGRDTAGFYDSGVASRGHRRRGRRDRDEHPARDGRVRRCRLRAAG